jgi:hypothetical protein
MPFCPCELIRNAILMSRTIAETPRSRGNFGEPGQDHSRREGKHAASSKSQPKIMDAVNMNLSNPVGRRLNGRRQTS